MNSDDGTRCGCWQRKGSSCICKGKEEDDPCTCVRDTCVCVSYQEGK